MKKVVCQDSLLLKDIEKVIEFPNAAKDEFGRSLVAGAVGLLLIPLNVQKLFEAGADAIVIDTAHTVIQQVFFVKLLKFVPTSQIVL